MKNVLITGASGNLGKASVEKFLAEGYRVLATVSAGKTLPFPTSREVITYEANLTNEQEVEAAVQNMLTSHKRIDAALLLVGGFSTGTVGETDGSALKKMFSINFETAYYTARPVFDQMKKQRGGRIILVGSRPALIPSDGTREVAYALSKSLVFRLAEILNEEGKDINIVCSVIVPGTIDTPANRAALPTADFTKWVTPEEIANTMFFLTSDHGQSLRNPVLKLFGNT